MGKSISTFHSLIKNLNKIHKASCEGVTVVQSSILYETSLHDDPSMQTIAEAIGMDITHSQGKLELWKGSN